jgi:hypothetical protein
MNNPDDKKKPQEEKSTQEIPADVEVGKKLIEVLTEVLSNKQAWDSSLLLRAIKNKLDSLLREANEVVNEGLPQSSIAFKEISKALRPGYVQIYVLLYQFEGNKMQNWQYALRALVEHSTNRPAYRSEKDIQELIRSKREIEKYGYAVVNIKEESIYIPEKKAFDSQNHEIVSLKEGAINLQNLAGFVHGNKKYYELENNTLIYKSERAIPI